MRSGDGGPNGGAEGGGPARILVVDDEDEHHAAAVSTALRYEGFEVQTAATGRAALTEAASLPARPRAARRHAAGPRRVRGAAGACRATGDHAAGGVPDRPTRHRGPRARPDRRRRRLRDQAVQPRGARSRACARCCGARAARRRPQRRIAYADLELDEDTHEVRRAGDPGRPHAHRVQPAALPDVERRPRAAASRRSSTTSGTTTSAATPTSSRPTSATCARSSTGSARR